MKISASVYSNKEKTLEALVQELDRYEVDFFHIDCNDNPAVFKDIAQIRSLSKTPIDLHIITAEPEKYVDGIAETKPELVCFQYENLPSKLDLSSMQNGVTRFGLAIQADTSHLVFDDYKKNMDFILFMATSPGKSGGTFNQNNFSKIRQFKKYYPQAKMHVDGGVNDEVSFVLRSMGVSLVVSGNYLVNADYIGHAIHKLRSNNIASHILVKDFMVGLSDSPVLRYDNFNFHQVLNAIEVFNMGFTMLSDASGRLEGIITNADVRRGLLKNITNLNLLDPARIVNRNPATINENCTVSELIEKIRSLSFPALFLPVIDDNNTIKGTITFNNLIKGEA